MSHHYHIPKLCAVRQGVKSSGHIAGPVPKKLSITKLPITKPKAVAIQTGSLKPPIKASLPVVRPKNKLLSQNQRKTGIKYITKEITKHSLDRINSIKDSCLSRILVIIGNGPSINEVELQNLKDLPNVDVLSINQPDMRIWPTKYWAFFDRSQQKRHELTIKSYDGIMLNSTSINSGNPNSIQFKHLPGTGFSLNLTEGLYIGRSSVYASMQIAAWMGYQHIFVLGCDMNAQGIGGRLHFYGHNPDVKPELRAQRFAKEAESYEFAAMNLEESIRLKFTFCTEYNPFGFVHKFNLISHKAAIQSITQADNMIQI